MLLRSVMSTTDTSTNNPSSVGIGLSATSTGISLPSLRRANSSRPAPIARARASLGVGAPQSDVRHAKAFRNQHFDRLRDEFLTPVAEHGLGLRIRERDHASVVDQKNRARNRFDDRAEALLACAELCRKLCRRNHVPAELVAHRQDD